MTRPHYNLAWPNTADGNLWGWTSHLAVARAVEASLTYGNWTGHEVFNITADDICWEGGVTMDSLGKFPADGKRVGALDLLRESFPGTEVDETWWAENDRRSFWDCRKAEKMLMWKHD